MSLTINYAIENKIPMNRVLTQIECNALLTENREKDYSYLCLLREQLSYANTTIGDVLRGWGGVQLVKLPQQV